MASAKSMLKGSGQGLRRLCYMPKTASLDGIESCHDFEQFSHFNLLLKQSPYMSPSPHTPAPLLSLVIVLVRLHG